jgi:hypothetical protein
MGGKGINVMKNTVENVAFSMIRVVAVSFDLWKHFQAKNIE